jgi:recombination protein RecA
MARKSSRTSQPLPNDSNGDDARKAVLDRALGDIIKRYGEGSIMRMGEAMHLAVEAIPTGSLSLDIALGVGGIPRARITEIFGPESSGKTTLCLHIVAESQRMGGTAAYIDMEHALDPPMLPGWASTSRACWSHSPTPASRRSKSPKPWCAPARLMLL